MSDPEKPRSPEEIQKDLQDFIKNNFGGQGFSIPLNMSTPGAEAGGGAEETSESDEEQRKRKEEALAFSLTPAQVKAHLDRFVIGQEEAKKALSVAVCDHYNNVKLSLRDPDEHRDDYIKQNVILLGPTGVGKTYLIRTIAQLVGVPFVKADITKFSETGYVGGDVDDLVRELVRMANGDIELAEHGIIFLDEIDKIASSSGSMGKDVSGRGVQTGLLKLLEDTEVNARSPNDISSQFQEIFQMRSGGKASKRTVSTRHILFVVSGAFSGMEELINKRLQRGNIGFVSGKESTELDRDELFAQVNTQDFVDYGFEPEFIGRLPIRVSLKSLSSDDLFTILTTSEGSILRQHERNFRGYGLDVAFTPEALERVASIAHQEKTGARGLMTVLESRLRDFKFHLPGGKLRKMLVTEEVIERPSEALDRLLADPHGDEEAFDRFLVERYGRDYRARSGVKLKFDAGAVTMAISLARELDLSVTDYLETVFGKQTEFLRSIQEKSGREFLPVTPQVLNNPIDGVDLWLRGEA